MSWPHRVAHLAAARLQPARDCLKTLVLRRNAGAPNPRNRRSRPPAFWQPRITAFWRRTPCRNASKSKRMEETASHQPSLRGAQRRSNPGVASSDAAVVALDCLACVQPGHIAYRCSGTSLTHHNRPQRLDCFVAALLAMTDNALACSPDGVQRNPGPPCVRHRGPGLRFAPSGLRASQCRRLTPPGGGSPGTARAASSSGSCRWRYAEFRPRKRRRPAPTSSRSCRA
jgi:hypothetical protein